MSHADMDLVGFCLLALGIAFAWVVGAPLGRGFLRLRGAIGARLRRTR